MGAGLRSLLIMKILLWSGVAAVVAVLALIVYVWREDSKIERYWSERD